MSKHHTQASKILLIVSLIAVAALLTYSRVHRHQVLPQFQSPTAQSSSTVPELTSAKCHQRGELPDPVCTPGVIDPAVTADNVGSTICVRGYTATVRPPASYTSAIKRQQMSDYGFTDAINLHEEDHLISLELGGSPRDPANLWPEPGVSPNKKDRIENLLHVAICAGQISLAEAQHRISTDWTTAATGIGTN